MLVVLLLVVGVVFYYYFTNYLYYKSYSVVVRFCRLFCKANKTLAGTEMFEKQPIFNNLIPAGTIHNLSTACSVFDGRISCPYREYFICNYYTLFKLRVAADSGAWRDWLYFNNMYKRCVSDATAAYNLSNCELSLLKL